MGLFIHILLSIWGVLYEVLYTGGFVTCVRDWYIGLCMHMGCAEKRLFIVFSIFPTERPIYQSQKQVWEKMFVHCVLFPHPMHMECGKTCLFIVFSKCVSLYVFCYLNGLLYIGGNVFFLIFFIVFSKWVCLYVFCYLDGFLYIGGNVVFFLDHLSWSEETSPPGGVVYLLCSVIKSRV